LSAGCAHVGPSRAHVEPSWAHLGFMLGQARPSTHVEPSGPSGPILAQVGPMLGSSWSHVGRMLALCWPMLGLCLSMLSHLGSYVGVMLRPFIYVETILRCQFFLPGPLLEPEHRQDKIRAHRRARNTVKKQCFYFLTPQAKHTINYRGFSRHGVAWWWFGGELAAGEAAPIWPVGRVWLIM